MEHYCVQFNKSKSLDLAKLVAGQEGSRRGEAGCVDLVLDGVHRRRR